VTLERPWLGNLHDVSCIPAGTYTAVRFPKGSGKRDYDVFKLTDVPARDDVELHIGNLPKDTEGCILIGTRFGQVYGEPGIQESEPAFDRFMASLNGVDTWTLFVTDPTAVSRAA
jgi:hypothetical protein